MDFQDILSWKLQLWEERDFPLLDLYRQQFRTDIQYK